MKLETIVLGGGCFWCTEAVFRLFKGITKATVGYSGGKVANPTYEQICNGDTGHIEVLEVEFNPKQITLEKLLGVFFTMHDPTSVDKQGADEGIQYRSVIFYTTDAQKKACTEFIMKSQEDYDKKIVTEVKKLDKFYPAEGYHQRYYERNPGQPYCTAVIGQKIQKVKKKYGFV